MNCSFVNDQKIEYEVWLGFFVVKKINNHYVTPPMRIKGKPSPTVLATLLNMHELEYKKNMTPLQFFSPICFNGLEWNPFTDGNVLCYSQSVDFPHTVINNVPSGIRVEHITTEMSLEEVIVSLTKIKEGIKQAEGRKFFLNQPTIIIVDDYSKFTAYEYHYSLLNNSKDRKHIKIFHLMNYIISHGVGNMFYVVLNTSRGFFLSGKLKKTFGVKMFQANGDISLSGRSKIVNVLEVNPDHFSPMSSSFFVYKSYM